MPEKTTEQLPDIIHPEADGFIDQITPKKTEDGSLFALKCPSCGHHHFRHAGYMKVLLPYMRSGSDKKVDCHDQQVWICVKCRAAFIWWENQLYDVTDKIDMKAWEKLEKVAHKATGPGGQC